MTRFRPASAGDLAGLVALVAAGGASLTTLPPDRERLAARIAASEASFAGRASRAEESYLFVLEDGLGGLAGVSGLDAAVGLAEAWYAYRVGLATHASPELGVFTQTPTLFLTNDHTGQSELCSLLLAPGHRGGGLGALLSKARLLFIAEHRARFGAKLIAELRGVTDERDRSPFWEGLGRHFFSMDFSRADRLTGIGRKSFVAELMPRHPVYANLLAPDARAAIGRTHAQTEPARRLLESEGLRYEGLVDIFDAGPVLEAALDDVGAIRHSRRFEAVAGEAAGRTPWLVSNTAFGPFRACLAPGAPEGDRFPLGPATRECLGIRPGDAVRAVPLHPSDRTG